jgi:hypothetical protein
MSDLTINCLILDRWVITRCSHFEEMDTIPGFIVSNYLRS